MERTVLIKNQLEDIKILKDKHSQKSDKLKKINDIFDVVIIATGSISTSVMIIGLSSFNPILIAIGTGLGFISTFLGVINKTMDFQGKYLNYKNTANCLNDLYRDTNITLGKNGLSSDDKAHILHDLAHRLSIIENSSLPL
jgi:threonine dehydrogenase-like Zn-dependent dehydrogenase